MDETKTNSTFRDGWLVTKYSMKGKNRPSKNKINLSILIATTVN